MRYPPRQHRRTAAHILVALFAAAPLCAQQAPTSILRGNVQVPASRPAAEAAGVAVSVLETGEATTTDSIGRFILRTTHRGLATIVARRVAYVPATIDVTLPTDSIVTLVLEPQPPALTTMTVMAAGEFTLGSGRTATLTPLQVAMTPGAAANVSRALQTLPGAQAVDEGSGLFVRGGDVTETRVLLDEAWLLSPARFDNPTGHVTTTVNPFLLDRTVFSTGGFGAQYGNALSGLVRLETASRPERTSGTATLSIGSAGAALALAPHRRVGARISANVNNLAPLISVFGEAQPFDPAPRGGDVSATAEWQSGPAGRVRLFALRERSEAGVGNSGTLTGTEYLGDTRTQMLVLSWRDSAHRVKPALTIARSSVRRDEQFSGIALGTTLGVTHLVGSLRWPLRDMLTLNVGGDLERLDYQYDGTLTPTAAGAVTTEPRLLFSNGARTDRTGAHADVAWQHARGFRVVAGLRTDAATITDTRTLDPRLSVAWQLGRVGLTAAWGVQHQVAEPVFFRPRPGADRFEPMRVAQGIVGVQVGNDTSGVRLELYDKRYRNLWQFTREYDVAGTGTGMARGADLMLRHAFRTSWRSRLAWSVVQSDRTDPNTGIMAPALGDVRHSLSWITDRTFGRLTVSSALRMAGGRPFTDVTGDAAGNPVWGVPNGSRLPGYRRSDIGFSWYRPIDGTRAVVLWGDLSNVFDRGNVMRYRYTAGYRERLPVRAPFNRALYAGATLLF
jgi:vitamin B12 transporter